MCLIPVKFYPPNPAILKSHLGNAFELSPAAVSVNFLQIRQGTDKWARSNKFDILKLANNFKIHAHSLAYHSKQSNIFADAAIIHWQRKYHV